MCSGKIGWNRGEGMDKHSYPQCASICQCVGLCVCVNGVWLWFLRWKNERASPVTLATSIIHVSYMTWLQTHTKAHKCKDAHPHVTKSSATALSACQWLGSPRSQDGLRDTVTVSQDPRRQPWDKKLIIAPRTPRWMAGGHTMMRMKGWRRSNRPEAYCGDGEISTSATVATQTDRI